MGKFGELTVTPEFLPPPEIATDKGDDGRLYRIGILLMVLLFSNVVSTTGILSLFSINS